MAANLDRFYNQGEADRVPTFALMKLLACDVLPVPSLMYTDVGVVLPLADARRAHEMLEGTSARPRGKIVLDAAT